MLESGKWILNFSGPSHPWTRRVGRAWMAEAATLAFNVSVPSEGLQGRSRLVRLSWTAAAGE